MRYGESLFFRRGYHRPAIFKTKKTVRKMASKSKIKPGDEFYVLGGPKVRVIGPSPEYKDRWNCEYLEAPKYTHKKQSNLGNLFPPAQKKGDIRPLTSRTLWSYRRGH